MNNITSIEKANEYNTIKYVQSWFRKFSKWIKNNEIYKLNKVVNSQDKIIDTLKQKIETITKLFTNKLTNAYNAIGKLLRLKDKTIDHRDYEKKVNKKDEMQYER